MLSEEEREDLQLREQHRHQWTREVSSRLNASMLSRMETFLSICQELHSSIQDVASILDQCLSSLFDSKLGVDSRTWNCPYDIQALRAQACSMVSEVNRLREERNLFRSKIDDMYADTDIANKMKELTSQREREELARKALEPYVKCSSDISTITENILACMDRLKVRIAYASLEDKVQWARGTQ